MAPLRGLHWLSTLVSLAVAVHVLADYTDDPESTCNDLSQTISLSSDGNYTTTILNSTYYDSTATVSTLGTCANTTSISSPLCRVQFVVNTSSVSAITAEVWLPTTYSNRFLSLGNGGLGGCIEYTNLDYGTSYGFATVGSNNGHDGDSGSAFANNTEVLADFTTRSIHLETVVGKEIATSYYGSSPNKTYYLGCSSGGRQGMYAALHFPEDFDGIVAGSPATNFHGLLGWSGMLTKYIGAPDYETSPTFISSALWDVVSTEVMNQCDGNDGVVDQIITEPDTCDFRPEALLCEDGDEGGDDCLTTAQVEALRNIYSPIYGLEGQLWYPRLDPGAEVNASSVVFSGEPFSITWDWMKYVVLNDPDYDFRDYGLKYIQEAMIQDPGNVSTYSGDLSTFRDGGGKLISYHGRADPMIASGNSKNFYNQVARTLNSSSSTLDDFYRLFLIPGMGHCEGSPGGVLFGQSNGDIAPSNSSADNVLMMIVDWVENGNAPDSIRGATSDGSSTRLNCRYPQKSEWNGEEYVCS